MKKSKNSSKVFKSVHTLTLAAMLTAMSVVIAIFCKTYFDYGGGLYRITFENLPIILSGIIFGPVIGGIVGSATDWISYLLSGQVYPPNIIVNIGATLIGVISGLVSRFVIKKHGYPQIIVAGAAAHLICSMIIKPIGLFTFYGWWVLVRVPIYLLIAPAEITVMCMLYKNRMIRKLFGWNDNELH